MIDVIDRNALCPIIGRNVARFRVQKGLSQGALAQKVGLSRGQINRIEQGHDEPRAAALFSLADALDVDADDLRRFSATSEKISS
jgi:transcriptional regulator with XRE-family HTH domain